MKQLVKTWDDEEFSRWYSLTMNDGSNVIALIERDRVDETLIHVKIPGTAEPILPKNVKSATRMALVDADWLVRVNKLYLRDTDARGRFTSVRSALEALQQSLPAAAADPTDPVAARLAVFEAFADVITKSLVPAKDGIVDDD
jgi:hypothetical protein